MYYINTNNSEHKKGRPPLPLLRKYKEYWTYEGLVDPSCIVGIFRIVNIRRISWPFPEHKNCITAHEGRKIALFIFNQFPWKWEANLSLIYTLQVNHLMGPVDKGEFSAHVVYFIIPINIGWPVLRSLFMLFLRYNKGYLTIPIP